MKTVSIFLLLLASALSRGSAQDVPQSLDTYVKHVMRAFDVPGIALTIVRDGQVILARGYGIRTLGLGDSVDGQTQFAIASNSKAFTATALALLVESGQVGWDTPVVRYMPWFRMSDSCVTNQLTVKDLLVHRSGLGLGAGDLLWWPPTTYTRKEVVERLRAVPLAAGFRSTYAYDNVLYTVAGERDDVGGFRCDQNSWTTWYDPFVSASFTRRKRTERGIRPC
jgi:CubicO group peptidase (beta-lactamase class C family)